MKVLSKCANIFDDRKFVNGYPAKCFKLLEAGWKKFLFTELSNTLKQLKVRRQGLVMKYLNINPFAAF